MPKLFRIAVYPLKSFDPIFVDQAGVLANGALEYDRRFALVDAEGKFMNAKRTAAVHLVQVNIDPHNRTLVIRRRSDDHESRFDIDSQRPDVERWFSEYFSQSLKLVENTQGGYPDDGEAPGPTIVSTASLRAVVDWFPGLTLDEVRLRFRANLEIADVDPFWEDHLFNAASAGDRPFRIGDAVFGGSNPCQRCIVPSRDPTTGNIWPEFARRFSEFREVNLPAWAARDRFNHFYRFTVNTRLIAAGRGYVQVGDQVQLIP